jgi:hypothetical protein
MNSFLKGLLILIFAAAASQAAMAQAGDGAGGRRMQGGGINWAPMPQVFEVVSVDSYNRNVRMRAKDGTTEDVHVGEGVYDLSKLQPGDKIQVNFIVPDAMNPRLAAASIWPVP